MADSSIALRVQVHAALADPHRLAIVDELSMSDRSPSELGARLDIGSNLLAHHLAVLEVAGLIERLVSAGDGRRRYVRLVPEALGASLAPAAAFVARHVLFVCTANSARSQLAAAAWNARHEVPASSAGTRPAARVRREAIAAGARGGLDLAGARPRSLEEVDEPVDLVVTVCDVAHEELGSLPPGDYARADRARSSSPPNPLPAGVSTLHWSIPDPAGSRSPAAYDDALRSIGTRIGTLAPRVRPRRRSRRSRP